MPIPGPQATLQLALQHHQAGRLGEAERLYRQLLASHPNQSDALRNLGFLAHQTRRHDLAVELIRRSIAVKPDVASAHNNLGEALRALGRLDEAAAAYRQAIRIDPRYPEAHNNLGGTLLQQGHAALGIAELRRAIELRPDYGRAMLNLGNALAQSKQIDGAITMLRAAARLLPTFPPAHALLGDVLLSADRPDEAIESFRAAVTLDGRYGDALNGLGRALRVRGRWAEALEAHQVAARVRPEDPDALAGQAACFVATSRFRDAIAALNAAIARRPNHAPYHNDLGEVFRKAGLMDAAAQSFRRALELDSSLGQVHNNLALALSAQGAHDEALPLLRRAVELSPDSPSIHGNLLMALNYRTADPRATFEEHARWGKTHAPTAAHPMHRPCTGVDPERPLRIGYVSPDLRHHPVAAFLEPLLAARDRSRFTVVAYSDTLSADAVTQRLRGQFDEWRDVIGLSDDAVAQQIASDRIDVLVDLAGHTARNRLTVFARRAAPVQMTYLGYPNTTGVDAIGYRLTDAIADPPGESDALHTEKLLRLPRCFLCYRPSDVAADVSPPPVVASGAVTFGSFNNFIKVSPDAMRAWGEILRALPGARLLLRTSGFAEEATDRRVRESLAAHGVPVDRVELLGTVPSPAEFLATYGRVDVALDTFPYNGTTTTCEALWMGVPVVTFAGNVHASRVSASILTSAGLTELIAPSRQGYVELAVSLARDVPRLSSLRATLRERLRASELLDAAGHARAVEAAFRDAWRAVCAAPVE